MSMNDGMKHGDKLVYFPRTGKIVLGRGDIAQRDADKPLDFIGTKTLATMKQVVKTFSAAIDGLKSAAGLVRYHEYEINYQAASRQQLIQMAERKQLLESIQENGYTDKGMIAAATREQL